MAVIDTARLTQIVSMIVRQGPEAPRIRKIRGFGSQGAFSSIIADTVDRLLANARYARALPAAFTSYAENGDPELLIRLIVRAAGASRKKLLKQTAAVSSTPVDVTSRKEMAAYTDSDRAYETEPTQLLAKQEAESNELRCEEIKAAERADFNRAVSNWANTLRPKQRYAVELIGRDHTNAQIREATRNRWRRAVDEDVLTRLRKERTALADRWLRRTSLPLIEEARAETIAELPDRDPESPSDLVAIDGGFRTQLTYEDPHRADLDSADRFGQFSFADADAADSANDRGSGRQSNREALLGSRWGAGKKQFSADLLVTGGTGWDRFDPAAIAEWQEYAAKNYSERELRDLLGRAGAAGINVRRLLREAAARQARTIERKMQARQARVTREAELFRRDSKTHQALRRIAEQAGIGPESFDGMVRGTLSRRKPAIAA